MTISSPDRKAGPYSGNGVTTSFAFSFKTFNEEDIRVVLTDTDAVESDLTIDTDYSVSLNADQDDDPGGTVTYSTLATGEKLTIVGNLSEEQPTDLTTGSGFYARVIENALDRGVILVQQIAEKLNRSIRFPVSDADNVIELPTAAARANKAVIFDADGGVTVSADDYDDQAANAASSASAAATSATNAATSATNAATSATAAAASVTSAAAILDDFDDRYLGAKSSDPTLDNDGNALISGALYFSTASNTMKVYTGSAWQTVATPSLRYGSGAPSNGLGSNDDFYINISSWMIYGPKASGAWPSGTSLVGPAGSGSGDVVGPSVSVDGELALFDATTGKLIKRASTTGLLKAASGVVSAAVAGTDYLAPSAAGALVYLSTVTASASATVDIETTFDGTYDVYLILADGVVPSSGSEVDLYAYLKLSGSYKSGSYNYTMANPSNGTYSGSASQSASSLRIATDISSTSGRSVSLAMHVFNPASTSLLKNVIWQGMVNRGSNNLFLASGGGSHTSDTGALTGVRFAMSSGNIASGSFRLYGIKKS